MQTELDYSAADEAWEETFAALRAGDLERARASAHRLLDIRFQEAGDLIARDDLRGARRVVRNDVLIDSLGTIFALANDKDGIDRLSKYVNLSATRKLEALVAELEAKRKLMRAIEKAAEEQPGILQRGLKHHVGVRDGHEVAHCIALLMKVNRIRREPVGRSDYGLYRGTGVPTPIDEGPSVGTHRHGVLPEIKRLNWADIPLVELPESPSAHEVSVSSASETRQVLTEEFEIAADSVWQAHSVVMLPAPDRPDPVFRKPFLADDAVLVMDDLGKADRSGKANVLRIDRHGHSAPPMSFAHDLRRWTATTRSGAVIGMSMAGVLFAYDSDGKLLFETDVSLAPEVGAALNDPIRELARFLPRFPIRNFVRGLSLADDKQHYIYCFSNQAWCISVDGEAAWAIELPVDWVTKYGRLTSSEVVVRPFREVQDELGTLGVEFPGSFLDLCDRYIALSAGELQDSRLEPEEVAEKDRLRKALTILTGRDPREELEFGDDEDALGWDNRVNSYLGSFGLLASETSVSAFSGSNDRCYVTSSEGDVIELTRNGEVVRRYSIGTWARRVVDTGDYLYILTDTCLYVVQDGVLISLLDATGISELLVSSLGFGLLETRRFRWFDSRGELLCNVGSNDPLRRIYQNRDDVIVETRRHRLTLANAQIL